MYISMLPSLKSYLGEPYYFLEPAAHSQKMKSAPSQERKDSTSLKKISKQLSNVLANLTSSPVRFLNYGDLGRLHVPISLMMVQRAMPCTLGDEEDSTVLGCQWSRRVRHLPLILPYVIYLSCSQPLRANAHALVHALKEYAAWGLQPGILPRNSSRSELVQAITGSDLFIILVDRHYRASSRRTSRELDIAWRAKNSKPQLHLGVIYLDGAAPLENVSPDFVVHASGDAMRLIARYVFKFFLHGK